MMIKKLNVNTLLRNIEINRKNDHEMYKVVVSKVYYVVESYLSF